MFKYFFCCLILFAVEFSVAQSTHTSFKHLSLKEGLSQSPVFALLQDKKGFVWIGNREGLIRFDGYDFKKYINTKIARQNTIHNDIRSIYEDRYSNLWIGTPAGVYEFNPGTETFTAITFGDLPLVYSIIPDGEKIWVATSLGLRLIDTKTKKILPVNLKGPGSLQIKSGWVSSLYLDKLHNILWVGSNKGVSCLNTVTNQTRALPGCLKNDFALNNSRIFTIKQDKEGDLWFGTFLISAKR
ncbi:MAG: hypothetical protein EOP45_03245 [Sphingobacteriaceae bacterium]|nr:MAG: hypothetical protein EOP45_03245 [Sphingobacteriaceae bacterium]